MKELRADDRLLSRRGEGMAKHKRRILQILAITALAVSGFIAAGALAGGGARWGFDGYNDDDDDDHASGQRGVHAGLLEAAPALRQLA
jgi:hypothetical protein